MKAIAAALLMLLAGGAGAQTFVSMGRLFTTPGERVQLDLQRNTAPAAPAERAAENIPGVPAEALPVNAAAANVAAGGSGNVAGEPARANADGDVPGQVRLGGLIQRRGGAPLLIVNGEVQPAPAQASARGGVRMEAGGRSIMLKPGQRYDPATGEIHDAAR